MADDDRWRVEGADEALVMGKYLALPEMRQLGARRARSSAGGRSS